MTTNPNTVEFPFCLTTDGHVAPQVRNVPSANAHVEFPKWLNLQLQQLEARHAGFVTPNSVRRHLKSAQARQSSVTV